MSTGEISSKTKKLFGYGLVLTSLWLAVHAFRASMHVDSQNHGYSKSNLYLSSRVAQSDDLAVLIENKSQGLEFMVWDHERRKLSRQLSELLRQRINIDSFNGTLWTQLTHLQKDAGVSASDRAWTIERASKLLRWNINERSELSHYCISEYAEFTAVAADLCSSLISNLPKKWPDQVQAIKANVRLSVLQDVLRLERKKIEDSRAKSR